MKLLTDELRKKFPPLYGQEHQAEKIVYAKFFTPWSNWTWYAMEFDGEDLFFGVVDGHEPEFGYFSLSELENLRGVGGLRVERDIYFEELPLSAVLNWLQMPLTL